MKMNDKQMKTIKMSLKNRANYLQGLRLERLSKEDAQEYQDILLVLGEIYLHEKGIIKSV